MRVVGEFRVATSDPVASEPEITVGLPTGHMQMVKEYTGAIQGRSITQFSYVYELGRGGTYVATESFEGSVEDRPGRLAWVHSATDHGDGRRTDEFFLIVPGSGTGDLAGIVGGGAIEIDDDGAHRVVLDVTLP
jgi:hypothetical protein